MKSEVMRICEKNGVTFLKYKIFDGIPFINHAVSTRHGGVSTEKELKSLNLGFKTDDKKENVIENYKRFCNAADFDVNSLVFAKQTHSANVRIADENDCGKGIFKERDYTDVDAHITNIPGISLVIHTADCVPVAFVDSKNKAIANAHCGWRGTFDTLALKTLQEMEKNFGTDPSDVICAIGPCICSDCYEVSKDLFLDFKNKFGFDTAITEKEGNYYLDLALINKLLLINEGVKEENIAVSDLCTCCEKEDLYSHRGLGPKRGLISSVICLSNRSK